MRFRNRFTAVASTIYRCKCGARLSQSIADGRETVIHELPWCGAFRALMGEVLGEPSAEHHVAVINVTDGETVVVADGDSPEDVDIGAREDDEVN